MTFMNICAVIGKIVAVTVLFIVLVVGWHAHFESEFTATYGDTDGRAKCKNYGEGDLKCPNVSMPFEQGFLAVTIIFLIASIIMIVLGCFVGAEMRKCDAFYHAVAGIAILAAGVLMLTSAIMIDKFNRKGASQEEYEKTPGAAEGLKDIRERFKYYNKLAAGALAIVDAIIYFVCCCLICATN